MKNIICVLVLLACFGCAPQFNYSVPPEEQNTKIIHQNTYGDSDIVYSAVYRVIDNEAGVVCYVFEYTAKGGGIDCMPLADTKLGTGK